jgi:hypothetical protein
MSTNLPTHYCDSVLYYASYPTGFMNKLEVLSNTNSRNRQILRYIVRLYDNLCKFLAGGLV